MIANQLLCVLDALSVDEIRPVDGDLIKLLRSARDDAEVHQLLQRYLDHFPMPRHPDDRTENTLAAISIPWSKFRFLVSKIQRVQQLCAALHTCVFQSSS